MTQPPLQEVVLKYKDYMPSTLKTNTPIANTPAIFLNKSEFKAGMKTARPYHKKNNHTHQLAREEGRFIFKTPMANKVSAGLPIT